MDSVIKRLEVCSFPDAIHLTNDIQEAKERKLKGPASHIPSKGTSQNTLTSSKQAPLLKVPLAL